MTIKRPPSCIVAAGNKPEDRTPVPNVPDPYLDPTKRVTLRPGAPAHLQADADAINAFLDYCDAFPSPKAKKAKKGVPK